jgi:hypothetical protein
MDESEQARIDQQIAKRISELDYEKEFTEAGRTWTEADAEGNVVHRDPVAEARARLVAREVMDTMALSGKALLPETEERLYKKALAAELAKRAG